MDSDDDAITVTSATQSEADVRASLGEPPVAAPPAPAAAAVDDAPPAPELEQEADSPKTDAEVSEAARVLRRSRSEKKVLKEIALRKQAEERAVRAETALAAAQRQAAPPASASPAPKADAAPAAASPAAPVFTFPTFDDYQTEHPDADYDAYTDARSDARDAWRDGVKRATAEHEARKAAEAEAQHAETTQAETFLAAEPTFEAAHPDYRDVLARVAIPMVPDPATGQPIEAPVVGAFRKLLFRAADKGPAILYFLGQHPEDAARIWTATNPASLIEAFTEVKLQATAGSPPAPALTLVPPRGPAKPVPDAPAPLDAVPGGAHHTRSLHQIADDSEDADEYIARRKAQATG